jgi:hypothetical protein
MKSLYAAKGMPSLPLLLLMRPLFIQPDAHPIHAVTRQLSSVLTVRWEDRILSVLLVLQSKRVLLSQTLKAVISTNTRIVEVEPLCTKLQSALVKFREAILSTVRTERFQLSSLFSTNLGKKVLHLKIKFQTLLAEAQQLSTHLITRIN